MHPGDLVGLISSKGPELAVVESVAGSRARLRVGVQGRTEQVPQRQLDLLAELPASERVPSRLEQAPWALSPASLAAAQPRRRDLAAAWLLLLELAEAEADLGLQDLVELVAPADTPLARAACWLALQQPDQQLFRWRHGRLHPRSSRDLHQLRRDRRRLLLAERHQQEWAELLRRRQPIEAAALDPLRREQLELLLALAAGGEEIPLPPDLRRALQLAHCSPEPGAVRHLLVDLGQWDRHALPSLRRTVWERGFAPALLAEAERLADGAEREQPGDGQRRDLTGLRSCTIDDADTEEIDDALSLERLPEGRRRIWVHIADPGRLVVPGSALDLEARRRASSLYLAASVVPMFPRLLAAGPFSLRQGQRCAAWSLAAELDDTGAVLEHELVRSWIRPTYRLTYEDGDALIELAPPQDPDLAELHTLLLRRRRWREQRGALLMEQSEGRIRCRGDEAQVEITDPSPARGLVAEAMILTGAVVAEHGRVHELALPYRGQPAAELPPAALLEALPEGPVRHAALKRCLSRGVSGVSPSPHFSLGLPAYVQATSPIRRYGDLIVQRQIGALLAGEAPLDAPALAELLEELEPPLREGIQISREDQRHWQQVWFEQHREGSWSGVVLRWLRPQDRLALVHLEDLALDQAVRCPEACEPGDSVMVQVQQVDSLSDLLRLEAR